MYPWQQTAAPPPQQQQMYQQTMYQQQPYYAGYSGYGQQYAAGYAQPYAASAPWQPPSSTATAEYNFEQPTTLESCQQPPAQQGYPEQQQPAPHDAPQPPQPGAQNGPFTGPQDPSGAPPLPTGSAPPLPQEHIQHAPPLPQENNPPLPNPEHFPTNEAYRVPEHTPVPPLPDQPQATAPTEAQQTPWQAAEPQPAAPIPETQPPGNAAANNTPWQTAEPNQWHAQPPAGPWQHPSGPSAVAANGYMPPPQNGPYAAWPHAMHAAWPQHPQYGAYPGPYPGTYAPGPHWGAPQGPCGTPPMTMVPVPQPVEPPQQLQKVVRGEELFREPGRSNRPRRIAVILRGLPGSGKSQIAKCIRDMELAAGAPGPRVLSIDEYFMVDCDEDSDEDEARRGKRKKLAVSKYQYEKELEGAYSASLLKAFQRTVEEARHNMVVLDACNVAVEDFKPFWMAAQVAGYEAYILKPLNTDPGVCASHSTHQRSKLDINQMASMWQDAPALYTVLDLSDVLPPDLGGVVGGKEGGGEAARRVEDGQTDGQESGHVAVQAERVEKRKPELVGASLLGVDYDISSDDEGNDPLDNVASNSKWSAIDDEFPEEAAKPQKKRIKTEPLAAAQKVKGILRKGVNVKKPQSVRWADQVPKPVGFQLSGASDNPYYELEHVLELEGLGPPKDIDHGVLLSFKQQCNSEHAVEKTHFRDILLGKR